MIFEINGFLHKMLLFTPEIARFGYIHLSFIADIFSLVMNHICAKFHTNALKNMNTTNNSQFLVIFAQFFNILPQNLANFGLLHADVIANKLIRI